MLAPGIRAYPRPAALLLAAAGLALVASGAWAAKPAARRLTELELHNQVLNRLAFGPRPGAQREVGKLGWENWVRQQLAPSSIDDAECEALLRERCPSLALPLAELVKQGEGSDREAVENARRTIKNELRESVLLSAVYSRRQFEQVIVEFWRNHFNVDVNKVPFLATHYEGHVLRRHAFGKFDELLLATAQHPAMLVYLDNYISNRRGLNENYAREIMELHTLGVDNFYAQADVVALARTLTGWSCGWTTDASGQRDYAYAFKPADHDPQPVKFLELELAGQDGLADGRQAILHLAHHPGTAKFLSNKLCRYLIDDSPPPELVERVAEVFTRSEGNLQDVYEAIIFSPEFASVDHYRTKFKTPLEFTVSTLRATDAQIGATQQILRDLEAMGQPIYECVEPTGYGDQREAWLDPGVMIYRWNFAIALVTGKIPDARAGDDFMAQMLKPAAANRSRAIMKLLLPGVVDKQTEKLIAFSPDVRAQVAYALGSPAFQQQ